MAELQGSQELDTSYSVQNILAGYTQALAADVQPLMDLAEFGDEVRLVLLKAWVEHMIWD